MRNILFVRHAAAEDPDTARGAGRSEAERRLTQEGVDTFQRAVCRLKLVHKNIDLIMHSPLQRACQTAELLGCVYPEAEIRLCAELAPGMQLDNLAEQLDKSSSSDIALVGHEPDFSHAIGDAVAQSGSIRIDVKKGSAILITFGDRIRLGEGCLAWSITSEQLNSFSGDSES